MRPPSTISKTQGSDRNYANYAGLASDIKRFYIYRTGPDYVDEHGHFSKSYKLWTPADLYKIDLGALRGIFGMTQWGYDDLLLELMPTYYSLHGGCAAFVHDIETVYRGGQR